MIQKLVDAKKLDAKKTVDHDALKAAGVARGGKDGVRLLAKGDLTAKLTFAVAGASKGAIEAVEKAGGKVELPEVKAEGEGKGKKAKRKAEAAAKKA
jgi:large subunit ribosomal protein L15